MRNLKNNVLLRLYNSYIVDSPQPANISYFWNFGSLLAICLVIQILTSFENNIKLHYYDYVKRYVGSFFSKRETLNYLRNLKKIDIKKAKTTLR